MNQKPLVWAHRGASAYCPENTLISFKKAIDLKADGIELDIQLTKDHELVVCHDETIDRTSNGKGWIKDFTLEELKQLNFNQKFPELGPQEIPTMKEVLDLIQPTDLTINIELKNGVLPYPGMEEMILDLIKGYAMEDRVNYSSFNHYSCQKIKELKPDAYVGLLVRDIFIDLPEYTKNLNMNSLNPALYLLQYPDIVQKCHELGIDLNPWYVDEEEYIRLCINAHVNAIITDVPDVVRKMINE